MKINLPRTPRAQATFLQCVVENSDEAMVHRTQKQSDLVVSAQRSAPASVDGWHRMLSVLSHPVLVSTSKPRGRDSKQRTTDPLWMRGNRAVRNHRSPLGCRLMPMSKRFSRLAAWRNFAFKISPSVEIVSVRLSYRIRMRTVGSGRRATQPSLGEREEDQHQPDSGYYSESSSST
jgi:hypothetical protein